jgi:hypothetical protein
MCKVWSLAARRRIRSRRRTTGQICSGTEQNLPALSAHWQGNFRGDVLSTSSSTYSGDLKAALTSFGVLESYNEIRKADKLIQLMNAMSKCRASQGLRGALEDGRDIKHLNVADVKKDLATRGGGLSCLLMELQ